MIICNDCGRIFEDDELKVTKDYRECFGFPTYEEFGECPYCGSDDFEEYEPSEEDEEEGIDILQGIKNYINRVNKILDSRNKT
jgi:RNA polymerase subunit RPABC4/transcription elongation factor Spt4